MRQARGFSLVELMVAVALALFVSVAVISVFVGSRSAYQATSGTAALTDGGRFALDFIQGSVRDAGFMACSRSVSQTSQLTPGDAFLLDFGEALGGYEAVGTSPAAGGAYSITAGTPAAPVTPDLSAADWATGLDPALVGLVVQGNDVLAVRSTMQNTQPVYVATIVDGASSFTVVTQQATLQWPVPGQFAVISDCADSLAMLVTQVAAAGPSTYTISHQAGGSGPVTNTTASFLPMSFQPGSEVSAVDTVVYYIGRGQDGDSALFAADLYDPTTNIYTGALQPKELVPDIEAMQVLYGVDTAGTQTVSEYLTADQVATQSDFNKVMSVKVAVLAASTPGAISPPSTAPTYQLLGTAVTAPMDTRSRQVFEVTIAVRNSLN
jgi:type IV pilus assembly protein PilW